MEIDKILRVIAPNDVFAIAERLCAGESSDTLRDVLRQGLEPFGFLGFTFAIIRRVKSYYLHAAICTTWSAETQNTFQQHETFHVEPVIVRSRSATKPFAWDLSIYDVTNPIQERVRLFRKALGVTGGICVPVCEAYYGRSVLYLSGNGFDHSPPTILGLQLIAAHFAARVYAVDDAGQKGRLTSQHDDLGDLSPREQQVFGWLAFGKSSREVAAIMSISEHTVNDHIASGVAKLSASNRTEAVLRALLTNQIDLSS